MEASSHTKGWLTGNRNVLSALLAVFSFVLVFLIALGANRSFGAVRVPEGGPGVQLTWTVLYFGALGALMIGLCVIAFVLLSGAGRRRRDDAPERVHELEAPWWSQALVLLLLLALLAAIVVLFVFLRNDGQEVSPMPVGPAPSVPLGDVGQLGDPIANAAVQWSFLGGVAVAVLVLGLLLMRRRWLRRRQTAVDSPSVTRSRDRRELRMVVEESLDDLDQEPDARRAVIRAYVGMERVLAEQGLGRRPHEAPVEYLRRWLASLGVSRLAGEQLTELFQRARFSMHTVDSQMKREAIEALAALRGELAGEGP